MDWASSRAGGAHNRTAVAHRPTTRTLPTRRQHTALLLQSSLCLLQLLTHAIHTQTQMHMFRYFGINSHVCISAWQQNTHSGFCHCISEQFAINTVQKKYIFVSNFHLDYILCKYTSWPDGGAAALSPAQPEVETSAWHAPPPDAAACPPEPAPAFGSPLLVWTKE